MGDQDSGDRGGRPHVVPGESSVRIGPFSINVSLAQWFKSFAKASGTSQGQHFRDALNRYRSEHVRGAPP